MLKKYSSIVVLYLVLGWTTVLGQRIMNGKVISDVDATPLFGATVLIDGKTRTSTDKSGAFSVQTTLRDTMLSINYIGFIPFSVQLQSLKDNSTFRLKKNEAVLDEVQVNTGYEILSKEKTTGSFTKIGSELLEQQVSTNILDRLEAVTNGIMVDRGTNAGGRITVRGISSIRGPKEPLIVLDNFPYNGDLDNINPNSIESITVLKDAAASSIWGAKAANGVIVITSKKGKKGQSFGIDFSSNTTFGNKPDLFSIPNIATTDFIDTELMLYEKGYYNSWINSSNKMLLSPVVERLIYNDHNEQGDRTKAYKDIDKLRDRDVRNDYSKYMYQNSVNQQHMLSLSVRADQISNLLSLGYDRNKDVLDANFERINVRNFSSYKPIASLELSTELLYTKKQQHSGRPRYGAIIQNASGILPYTSFADEMGHPIAIGKVYRQSYIDQMVDQYNLLDWNYYPLEDYKHTRSEHGVNNLLINVGIDYRPIADLNLSFKYQFEKQSGENRLSNDVDSYYTRDLINSFTEINSNGGLKYNIPLGGILDNGFSNSISNNFRGQLSYLKKWKRHEFSSLIGAEVLTRSSTGNANRLYGFNKDILTFGTVDYKNQYAHLITGSRQFIKDNSSISEFHNNFLSFFGSFAYNLKSRYFVTLSARRDASNLFGLRTNDQWNPFWSLGAAWKLSDESWFKLNGLSFLKVRSTLGSSGNIDPAMSAVTTIQYLSNSPYTGDPFSIFVNYNNPELRWETVKNLNFGLDFANKNNRISGSLDFYKKYGSNLFGSSQLDYTTGISTLVKNTASMTGKGLDIQLKTVNLKKSDLNWESTLNFSIYKDKVTEYYLGTQAASSFLSAAVPISGIAGKPVYSIFAYKWAGLDPNTGDPRGYLDGEVSTDYRALVGNGTQVDDLVYFGSALPTHFGSFLNSFSVKDFTLSLSISYKMGYYFRKRSINYQNLFSRWIGHEDFANRWQHKGDEQSTDVPSMIYPASTQRDAFYGGSEPLVRKGDHFRFQYINLTYTLPESIATRLYLKHIRAFFNVNNIGVIWRANKEKIDPDAYYMDYYMPTPKSFTLGLKLDL